MEIDLEEHTVTSFTSNQSTDIVSKFIELKYRVANFSLLWYRTGVGNVFFPVCQVVKFNVKIYVCVPMSSLQKKKKGLHFDFIFNIHDAACRGLPTPGIENALLIKHLKSLV